MFRSSFKGRIILPAIIVQIVLTVALTTYMSVKFSSYSDSLINEKVDANIQSLKFYIDSCKALSKAAATATARHPLAIEAVESQDRERILQIFKEKRDLYKVTFFTITDNKGIVLARTHDPDNYGDSVLKQQNIQNALVGEVSTYFEEGTVSRISARTGAPVYNTDGTLVGVISAGIRFDTNESVDRLKELFHADVTTFFGDTRICTTLHRNGERVVGAKLDSEIARIVLEEKKEFSGDIDVLGKTYKAFYMPLLNSQDEAFAALSVGNPTVELQAKSRTLLWNIFIISVAGLIAAIVILHGIITSISEPIVRLSKEMDRMEDGSLSIVVDARGNDEVGRAGMALQRVANTVHKLIDSINATISEHEKGNLDYTFDASVFRGDYRLLAERIAKLSSMGVRDKLTELPNRRSFDNRLDLEWNRAKREKTPLSILMIDVDKFKSYNDTYGHQQGDLVLQTVAQTIPLPIKRPVDFAARWGGEEFAVLLPNTDTVGAMHVAEMIRKAVENTDIPSIDDGAAKRVTISVGVSTQVPASEESIASLISQADEALYKAKDAGRNRVCRYEEE